MAGIITISECLKRLEAGEIVTLEVYKYDRKRKKGGQLDVMQCVLLKNDEKNDESDNREYLQALDSKASVKTSRNPNHKKFYTRNVRILIEGHPTGVIQRIHPPLIKTFNGIETVP